VNLPLPSRFDTILISYHIVKSWVVGMDICQDAATAFRTVLLMSAGRSRRKGRRYKNSKA